MLRGRGVSSRAVASRTAVGKLVRALDAASVRAALDESPDLLAHRDERGRSWLHLCCSVDVSARPRRDVDASIAIADDLLARGLDPSEPAFTEGTWHATPVWYAIGRGGNVRLAAHLLAHGADPDHSLWAAAFRDDLDAIDLLLDHGADLEAVAEGETPFLGAIKSSHFAAAWHLAERGADVDFQDATGMTALHYMLKKGSDTAHFVALAAFGPRLDIPDATGRTAADLLARKRDPVLRDLATAARGGR